MILPGESIPSNQPQVVQHLAVAGIDPRQLEEISHQKQSSCPGGPGGPGARKCGGRKLSPTASNAILRTVLAERVVNLPRERGVQAVGFNARLSRLAGRKMEGQSPGVITTLHPRANLPHPTRYPPNLSQREEERRRNSLQFIPRHWATVCDATRSRDRLPVGRAACDNDDNVCNTQASITKVLVGLRGKKWIN